MQNVTIFVGKMAVLITIGSCQRTNDNYIIIFSVYLSFFFLIKSACFAQACLLLGTGFCEQCGSCTSCYKGDIIHVKQDCFPCFHHSKPICIPTPSKKKRGKKPTKSIYGLLTSGWLRLLYTYCCIYLCLRVWIIWQDSTKFFIFCWNVRLYNHCLPYVNLEPRPWTLSKP